jgi:hypothetical protein
MRFSHPLIETTSFVIPGFSCQHGTTSSMVGEHISYIAMVNDEVGPMGYSAHCGNFAQRGDRATPVANGIGAKLARCIRLLTDALAARGQREIDREIAGVLARSGGRFTDSMEREFTQRSLSNWRLPR